MAKLEIIEKLNSFLLSHNPISDECQVVYLMVQLRKVLDHEEDHKENGSFTLLRFYCDWTVHTNKKRISKSMEKAMNEIFYDVKSHIEKPYLRRASSSIMRFLYMDNLRTEMKELFKRQDINSSIIEDESNWISFVQKLVKILENQPIKKPNADILEFSFLPASEGCVYGIIKFSNLVDGKDHYKFGNAY